MQGKIYAVFLLCILVPLVADTTGCNGKSTEENAMNDHKYEKDAITLQQAIEIGKKALKEAGYPYWNEELVVDADDNNTVWNKHISSSSPGAYAKDIKILNLNERKYWAIHYDQRSLPGEIRKDGDAFVFIDRSTGKVISLSSGDTIPNYRLVRVR